MISWRLGGTTVDGEVEGETRRFSEVSDADVVALHQVQDGVVALM